jgi:predicted nucleotidyltransferase
MSKLLRREHCELIVNWQSLWCPFTRRYYKTDVELVESFTNFLGFQPQNAPLFPLGQRPPQHLHGYLDSLGAAMRRFTEEMEPNSLFYQERDTLRRRLQDGLVAKGVVPPGTLVHVFGSTANGFGTKSSDMDMCITPPPGIEIAEDARPKLIENIAAALQQLGMVEVEPRATARIPYVYKQRYMTTGSISCPDSVHVCSSIFGCACQHLYVPRSQLRR